MRINPVLLLALLAVAASGCKSGGSDANGNGAESKHLTKLGVTDPVVGKGDAVEAGDEVYVTYTGKLVTGHIFDSNDKPDGKPFHVVVGEGQVIKGWDLGLIGMKKGGTRKLAIPYSLGYGSKGSGKILPDTDLYFDIKLTELVKKSDATIIAANDVKVGKGRAAKDGDTVSVSYVATAGDEVIDTQKLVKFKIGGPEMEIPGFDEALVGMQVGGERKVKVPPALTRSLHNESLISSAGVWDVKLLSIN